jgi:hypothetical protein
MLAEGDDRQPHRIHDRQAGQGTREAPRRRPRQDGDDDQDDQVQAVEQVKLQSRQHPPLPRRTCVRATRSPSAFSPKGFFPRIVAASGFEPSQRRSFFPLHFSSSVARFGSTTPKRAGRLAEASVDPTEATN